MVQLGGKKTRENLKQTRREAGGLLLTSVWEIKPGNGKLFRVNGLAIYRQWRGWNTLPRCSHCGGLIKSGVLYSQPTLPTSIYKTPGKSSRLNDKEFWQSKCRKLLL
jgi:hypothetical protein